VQTEADAYPVATQTPTATQNCQCVGTIPPSDAALQTTLPLCDMKQSQTESIQVEECGTQYLNPHCTSQGTTALSMDKRDVEVETDAFPSKHVQTYTITYKSKKTGTRTIACTSQTEPTSFTVMSQTTPVVVSDPPPMYGQSIEDFLQEKAHEMQDLLYILANLHTDFNSDGVT
jgi:hypothetical protein